MPVECLENYTSLVTPSVTDGSFFFLGLAGGSVYLILEAQTGARKNPDRMDFFSQVILIMCCSELIATV